MASSFLLIYYCGPSQDFTWVSWTNQTQIQGSAHVAASLPAQALEQKPRVIVMLPGEDISFVYAQIPARHREQWLQALPYAVEDQVIDPIDQLHFGVGASLDAQHPIAVIAKSKLQDYLQNLQERGIYPDAVIPDILALPAPTSSQANILLDHHNKRAIVRLPTAGFVVHTDTLSQWLTHAQILPNEQGQYAVTAYTTDSNVLFPAEETIAITSPILACQAAHNTDHANFLNGQFSAQHRGAPARRLWRVAAILLVLCGLAGTGYLLADYWLLQQQVNTYLAEARKIYQQVYPQGRMLEDPVSRMRAEYQQRTQTYDLQDGLALLQQVAPVLAQHAQIVITSIRYKAGTYEFLLLAPSVAELDRLREALAQHANLKVALRSANASATGATGQIDVHAL